MVFQRLKGTRQKEAVNAMVAFGGLLWLAIIFLIIAVVRYFLGGRRNRRSVVRVRTIPVIIITLFVIALIASFL